MGFGGSPYGVSAYGSSSSTITIAYAFAISTHGIRVVLSSEPMHADEFADGDATNPLTWSAINNSTGRALTVITASMHDATSVDLTVLEALGDHLESHTVTATGLLSAMGYEITLPNTATFDGVVQTVHPVDRARSEDFRDRDLANPPFQVDRGLGAAGTLVISDDGDFATDSGDQLVRKLVLRRFNTKRGAFRWLPTYGVTLEEKEPIASGGELSAVLRNFEDQAKQEPDVTNAVAHGSVDRSGVAIISVSMQTSGGATINVRMGSVSGRLVEL